MDLFELVELRPVLGDGAMGTMLLEKGLVMGDCPEAWNLNQPDVVRDIHALYREAGCDFVETNTLGANSIKLARYGLDGRLDEIIRSGVDAARAAAKDACMVAGSVGPTGVLLEPYGDHSREEIGEVFRSTALSMDKAGIDFFLVETMTDAAEAGLAIDAIKDISDKPIVATMSFSKGAKGYRTMMGTSPQEAASALTVAGADFVGTNCCGGMVEACEIMEEMGEDAPTAVVAQPNAGLPEMRDGLTVYPETPEAMAAGVERLLACGVRVVGGCCGTVPAHIKAMAAILGKC